MGRNLFCVHSKKHINDVPELAKGKMETNRKTLVGGLGRLPGEARRVAAVGWRTAPWAA
jgi:glycerol-3-phosphate O-acyltransferase